MPQLVLDLLNGKRAATIPCFSGLSSVIAPALAARGLVFAQIHRDPRQMVTAAASAFELYGWQSATLPTDLCVEAEALGAQVDFREDMPEPMWPLVAVPLFESPDEVTVAPGDITQRGRIPLVVEALRALDRRLRDQCPVGAFVPGPFTLAMQVANYAALLPAVRHSPAVVAHALDALTDMLVSVAQGYVQAGASFITIHEMGGSPGVVGPRVFGELILPRLQRLIAALPAPTILSVCGRTDQAIALLAAVGANALNVDQTNDLAHSRAVLGKDALLFGNLDPVHLIAGGTPESIRAAVQAAAAAGADAIMPGCDLYLQTPAENLRALVVAAADLRRPGE